ncbi:MAG: hypothetical protein OXR72_07635 [Gemmatimonadota bacterium]|nr:hypothetical protein [Gemmatimonadota bacterium]
MSRIFFLEEISNDDMNPYEAVSAASRESRRINQARMARDVSGEAEKPTTLSLDRLSTGKVKISYDVDDEMEAEDGNAVKNEDPAGS